VIDIGQKQKGNTFLPFGLKGNSIGTEEPEGIVCTLVPALKPCNGEPRCTIMPILRRKDFKSIDNHYDAWERGLMFTLAGLYFSVCFVTLFQVAYIQLNPNMTLLLHHIVQAAIFVIALMRGLFFVLVPTISWFQDNDIAEFVGPSSLFFLLIPF
jgi:hypothetical protein